MTRQEAIEVLSRYDMNFYDTNGIRIGAATLADAFDMAIEALQQQTCDNCKHNEETSGMNCYECVKGISDNYEALEQEPKRGEKAKTLFINLYNCEKFVNLSNGVVYMKIPNCSIYDEIGREEIVNCVRQDNFECCFTSAFERVERIKGE